MGWQAISRPRNGFKYVKENLAYADTVRAVALGGSWGGYMVNWLAGQPLGKGFKALVCDSGIFSTKTLTQQLTRVGF